MLIRGSPELLFNYKYFEEMFKVRREMGAGLKIDRAARKDNDKAWITGVFTGFGWPF